MSTNKPDPDVFYDIVSQPVKNCAKFYGYLYLNEVVDDIDIGFQYTQYKGDLLQAFVEYGRYAIMSEMTNLPKHAGIDYDIFSETITDFGIATEVDMMQLSTDFYSDTLYSREYFNKVHLEIDMKIHEDIMYRQFDGTPKQRVLETFEQIALGSEHMVSQLPDARSQTRSPKEKLRLQIDSYTDTVPATTNSTFIKSAKQLFKHLNWDRLYGKESWADIADLLIARRNRKDTIVIDGLWQIQHNTGLWLNKVNYNSDESYMEDVFYQIRNEMNTTTELYSPMDSVPKGTPSNNQISNMLDEILNVKRTSELWKIHPFIVNADETLSKYEHIFKRAGNESPYT
jgi:hypothetical protein